MEDKIKSLQNELKKIERKNSRLLSAFLNFDLDEYTYNKKRKALRIEQDRKIKFLGDLLSGFNYSKHLKSLVIQEYMSEYYVDLLGENKNIH